LCSQTPTKHLRGAARYLLDALDTHGKGTSTEPGRAYTTLGAFDVPFDGGRERSQNGYADNLSYSTTRHLR